MKLSSLSRSYHGFERLTYSVFIDHAKWYPDQKFHISSVDIELSNSHQANMATLRIAHLTERSALKKLMTGSCIQISIGYQEKETCVFTGYLHRIAVTERQNRSRLSVELEAMDVKGLMMLYKSSHFQSGKKRSALIKDCMSRSYYQGFIKGTQLERLPSALDYEMMSDSRSDYDLLCDIAQRTGFEFFVKGEKLVFQKAYQRRSELVFDTWDGVKEIEQETSLDEQYGNIELISLLGLEKMQRVKKKVSCQGKPNNAKMSKLLKFTTLTHVSEGYQSMEEMKAECDIFQDDIEHRYGTIRGVCVLLPELMCSDLLVFTHVLDEKEKKVYVQRVKHQINETECCSIFEGSIIKG